MYKILLLCAHAFLVAQPVWKDKWWCVQSIRRLFRFASLCVYFRTNRRRLSTLWFNVKSSEIHLGTDNTGYLLHVMILMLVSYYHRQSEFWRLVDNSLYKYMWYTGLWINLSVQICDIYITYIWYIYMIVSTCIWVCLVESFLASCTTIQDWWKPLKVSLTSEWYITY